MRVVLNVGGGAKTIDFPARYNGWRHDLLDIDPAVSPDILLDARELKTLAAASVDAIYCSHNLEHYYPHDAVKVVDGFSHVLKPEGFVEVLVPDLTAVMRYAVQHNLDPDAQLYLSHHGPIQVRDVIYGFNKEIERSGNDFYAHKNGYSANSLGRLFAGRHFPVRAIGNNGFELHGFFFKQRPSDEIQKLLGLSMRPA